MVGKNVSLWKWAHSENFIKEKENYKLLRIDKKKTKLTKIKIRKDKSRK